MQIFIKDEGITLEASESNVFFIMTPVNMHTDSTTCRTARPGPIALTANNEQIRALHTAHVACRMEECTGVLRVVYRTRSITGIIVDCENGKALCVHKYRYRKGDDFVEITVLNLLE